MDSSIPIIRCPIGIFSDWQPMFDVGDVTTDCCHLLLSKVYGFVGEKSPRNLEIGKLHKCAIYTIARLNYKMVNSRWVVQSR